MGVVENITADKFPQQGRYLGSRTKVMFHFGGPALEGLIVRDDLESPWQTIIQLDDGRVVLATECQYSPIADSRSVVHACPPAGTGSTSCCGRPPFELPESDRISLTGQDVTCPGRTDTATKTAGGDDR